MSAAAQGSVSMNRSKSLKNVTRVRATVKYNEQQKGDIKGTLVGANRMGELRMDNRKPESGKG